MLHLDPQNMPQQLIYIPKPKRIERNQIRYFLENVQESQNMKEQHNSSSITLTLQQTIYIYIFHTEQK